MINILASQRVSRKSVVYIDTETWIIYCIDSEYIAL
jgi:hypothetical protein